MSVSENLRMAKRNSLLNKNLYLNNGATPATVVSPGALSTEILSEGVTTSSKVKKAS